MPKTPQVWEHSSRAAGAEALQRSRNCVKIGPDKKGLGDVMKLISDLIYSFNPKAPNFRPTEIFNENWLIKIVLHQASSIADQNQILSFLPGSTWFSEGMLPTAFKSRYRGDKLGESRTNADGVIGHIKVGEKGKADLTLAASARQFTVIEAKIGAHLSAGTSNARYFDQAARNVACMAEVLARANIKAASLERLDFIVLAPDESIKRGTFSKELRIESINSKVLKRVSAYNGQLDIWYRTIFIPMLGKMRIKSLSWETVIDWIGVNKPAIQPELQNYYHLCLKYK